MNGNGEREDVTHRQIFPPDLSPLPPLRLEFVRIRSPNVLPAMHDMHGKIGRRAFRYEDGRIPILAPTPGKRRILVRVASVDGHDGVEAQRFIVDVPEVLAGLEFRKGNLGRIFVGAEFVNDDVAEFLVTSLVSGKVIED